MTRRELALAAAAGFLGSIPAANWLISNVGECIPHGPCLVPVGFGLMAPSGVFAIGAALVFRDAVHRKIVRAARHLRIWAHMGRVNSWERLNAARKIGCQSCDGNMAAFGKDRWTPMIRGFAERVAREPLLNITP